MTSYKLVISNDEPNGFKAIIEARGADSCKKLFEIITDVAGYPEDFFGYFLSTTIDGERIHELLPAPVSEDTPEAQERNLENTSIAEFLTSTPETQCYFVYDAFHEKGMSIVIIDEYPMDIPETQVMSSHGKAPQPEFDLAEDDLRFLEDDYDNEDESFEDLMPEEILDPYEEEEDLF